jgi:sugar phosphate isomerase/epimerase
VSHAAPIGRREFLWSSALAAGAALAGRARAADEFGGFTVGVQSYTFRSFDLERALKHTQELGLKYAELFRGHVPTAGPPEKVAAARKLCAEYGVAPIAFGVERFTKDHAANKKLFDFAAALGAKFLSADPDPDSFDSLDKLVEEYKVAIAIHPHGPQGKGLHRWYSAAVILKAVKDHHPLIGTCLDTGHLIRADILGERLDPAEEVRTMGARNFGIHLKDNDNEAEKRGVKPADANVVLGKGRLDVPAVLKALKEVKFKGYISIEYEANADNPVPDVRKCLEVLRAAVKQLG